MTQRVAGYLGHRADHAERKRWNELFLREQCDAFFDFYHTLPDDLPLRLSEMFLLDRRGYILADELQRAVIPLLDRVDEAAQTKGRVDTIVNEGGVLIGYCCNAGDWSKAAASQCALWFGSAAVKEKDVRADGKSSL